VESFKKRGTNKDLLLVRLAIERYDKGNKEFSTVELAKLVDMKITHPYFQQILKLLLNNGIIFMTKEIGRMRFYKIQRTKLRDFIDELPVVNLLFDYFKSYHTVLW